VAGGNRKVMAEFQSYERNVLRMTSVRLPCMAIVALFTHLVLVPLLYAVASWFPLRWAFTFSARDFLVFFWPTSEYPVTSYKAMYYMLQPDAIQGAWLVGLGLLLRSSVWITAIIVGATVILGFARFGSQRAYVKITYYALLGSYLLFYGIVAVVMSHLASNLCISPR